MMNLFFTDESYEGEPGPSIIILGNKQDMQEFSSSIREFLSKNMSINALRESIKLNGINEAILDLSKCNRIAFNINRKRLTILLTQETWEKIVEMSENLSNEYGFYYIDIDKEINFIIKSKHNKLKL